jgi:hypothetical protein
MFSEQNPAQDNLPGISKGQLSFRGFKAAKPFLKWVDGKTRD